MFVLKLIRHLHGLKTTIGRMYLNGKYFGYVLEDVVRGTGIKIMGETAIPAGTYNVKVSMSGRFKRLMPMIYSEENGYELIADGKSFKGIRIHGGNRAKDTHGCPLIAKNFIDADTIQGSLEKTLTKELIDLGGEGIIIISND